MAAAPRLLLFAGLAGATALGADGQSSLQRGSSLRAEEGARSAVLHAMQLGLDALQLGSVHQAKGLFVEAVAGIEAIYGESEQAARARSLRHAESEKIFKGEPYERSFAFYYSGVAHLLLGELDNAYASFRGAILHDAFAEEAQYQCDAAGLHFLAAWSGRKAGIAGWQALLARAAELRPELAGLDAGGDVLVIAELGRGPRKRTDGIGHNQLRFFPGRGFSERGAAIVVAGSRQPMILAEDVFFQASTRGGRKIDRILDDKVVFVREAADALAGAGGSEGMVGGGRTEAGAGAAESLARSGVGDATGTTVSGADAGGLVQGLVMMSRASVDATADARYWNNLPATIHLATPELGEGRHVLALEFLDEQGAIVPELSTSRAVDVVAGRPAVLWVSARERWGYAAAAARGGVRP